MKRVLLSLWILAIAGALLVTATGFFSQKQGATGTYYIEFDNAFGLVSGADFKIAGVKAGKIEDVELNKSNLHAVVQVQVQHAGFGQFHSDVFCQSRPQSLIGEYFVECQPGSKGPVIPPGSTIPVTHTESTIPADLLQDVMRMPYRERFTILINELGAAVAGRSEDINAALRRAVPALTETDNLLNLLANDSHTLQQLTVNSDSVITTLANNSSTVTRFIDEANRLSQDTETQDANLRGTFQQLPGFLEQLRPSLAQLSKVTDSNTPALVNLNAAAGQIDRLFTDLPPFSQSAIPAIKALGKASVTGKVAVQAATPTIRDLNKFSKPAPELAQNLAIVLHDMDNRSRAVEADSRSPGGKGYTTIEALLQFFYNTATAINTYGPFGHLLAVDLFVDAECTPFATAQTVAQQLATDGAHYRHCYSWLGPNQPGITTRDPSNPSACVPDPGGAPPGDPGVPTSACKLTSAAAVAQANAEAKDKSHAATDTGSSTPVSTNPAGGGGGGSGGTGQIPPDLRQGLGFGPTGGSNTQTQQLLKYLLSP